MKPLPKPIADYVEANARLDPEGMLRPFAPGAVVFDDGGRHEGTEALRRWIDDASIAAQAVFTPETMREENSQVVLEGPTHGVFKGSPLHFTLRFTLTDDAIQTLEIS